jgi:hypothetical protein
MSVMAIFRQLLQQRHRAVDFVICYVFGWADGKGRKRNPC